MAARNGIMKTLYSHFEMIDQQAGCPGCESFTFPTPDAFETPESWFRAAFPGYIEKNKYSSQLREYLAFMRSSAFPVEKTGEMTIRHFGAHALHPDLPPVTRVEYPGSLHLSKNVLDHFCQINVGSVVYVTRVDRWGFVATCKLNTRYINLEMSGPEATKKVDAEIQAAYMVCKKLWQDGVMVEVPSTFRSASTIRSFKEGPKYNLDAVMSENAALALAVEESRFGNRVSPANKSLMLVSLCQEAGLQISVDIVEDSGFICHILIRDDSYVVLNKNTGRHQHPSMALEHCSDVVITILTQRKLLTREKVMPAFGRAKSFIAHYSQTHGGFPNYQTIGHALTGWDCTLEYREFSVRGSHERTKQDTEESAAAALCVLLAKQDGAYWSVPAVFR